MPTVEFSPQQLNYMGTTSGGYSGIFGQGGNHAASPSRSMLGVGQIVLFSGTIPAQPRLMLASNFANALIWYNCNAELTTFTREATTVMTTIYKSAIATGTATWFALCYYTAAPPATNGTLVQRIIGTVGTIGSGADLEMVTTSIVTGNQYRVYNLRITLPSTYTY